MKVPRNESTSLINDVLDLARHKPADAALRQVLVKSRISPEDKRAISASVFRYFRWHEWLDHSRPLGTRLNQARDLQNTFDSKPASFPDADLLARAVPAWAHEVLPVTIELVRELQKEPRLWLRARHGTGPLLSRQLGDSEVHPKLTDAIWYRGEHDLYATPEFHQGAFEIQDLSSQLVGLISAPTPGETWWDTCAGEGGKLLHLCDLMQNKGLVWASDPAEWRLKILKKRAARANLFNYRVKPWTHSQALPVKGTFDGILVDAPCSGIGTWARNPHARWTTTRADVDELSKIQLEILNKVAGSLKKGGRLIYSVCTLSHTETTEVAAQFSAAHPEFLPRKIANPLAPQHADSSFLFLPQNLHANGMFVAAWTKE